MVDTPNLGVTHVTANQNQKEVTINEAFDRLDQAQTDTISISFAGGNQVLATDDFQINITFVCTGAVSAAQLTVPQIKKLFVIQNDSGYGITVVRGSTNILVPNNTKYILYTDGTADGLSTISGTLRYDMYIFHPQNLNATEEWFRATIPLSLKIPAGFTGSYATAGIAADTLATSLNVQLNGVNQGTINYAVSSTSATFTLVSDIDLVDGDVLSIENPGAVDGTLQDLSITIVALRV